MTTTMALLCRWVSHNVPLQRVQVAQRISAARMVTRTTGRKHITSVLQDLHWLPVYQRIKCKNLCRVSYTASMHQSSWKRYWPSNKLLGHSVQEVMSPNWSFQDHKPILWQLFLHCSTQTLKLTSPRSTCPTIPSCLEDSSEDWPFSGSLHVLLSIIYAVLVVSRLLLEPF